MKLGENRIVYNRTLGDVVNLLRRLGKIKIQNFRENLSGKIL